MCRAFSPLEFLMMPWTQAFGLGCYVSGLRPFGFVILLDSGFTPDGRCVGLSALWNPDGVVTPQAFGLGCYVSGLRPSGFLMMP
jgi:hypothetical protein